MSFSDKINEVLIGLQKTIFQLRKETEEAPCSAKLLQDALENLDSAQVFLAAYVKLLEPPRLMIYDKDLDLYLAVGADGEHLWKDRSNAHSFGSAEAIRLSKICDGSIIVWKE